MKKKSFILNIVVICLLLASCGKGRQETYYPSSSEMQHNLQSKGYQVSIQNEEGIGTHLIASKGDDFIEFYWLTAGEQIPSLEAELESKYPHSSKLVSMENDRKFGTFVFCSSEAAMEDAGILIIDVQVKI